MLTMICRFIGVKHGWQAYAGVLDILNLCLEKLLPKSKILEIWARLGFVLG